MDQTVSRSKILIISPAYYPSQGGVEVQMRLLVNELVKRGYQITIITKEISGTQKIEKTHGIHLFPVKRFKNFLGYLEWFFLHPKKFRRN